jgi:hypothetical protein
MVISGNVVFGLGHMRYRRLRCLTRIEVTDDVKPAFRWRQSNQYVCDFLFEPREHRVPLFLSLHAHLIIEQTLECLALKLLPQLFSRVTLLFYDVVHGFVCAYSMKQIVAFWRNG